MMFFKTYLLQVYGKQGALWFEKLPDLIKKIGSRYSLSQLVPFENSCYHYLLAGYQGSIPVVLKLGMDHGALEREGKALKAFAGCGTLDLLASEPGVLLLKRIIPGTPLPAFTAEKEESSVCIACDLIKKLYQSPASLQSFSHVKEWLENLDRNWPSIPALYLEKARTLRNELLSTEKSSHLLHGDFHHKNILQGEDGWVAIDPKGVIGEAGYDMATFIRNPIEELWSHPQARELIECRISLISAKLKGNAQRLRNWCFVQTVLGWTWALEDNKSPEIFRKSLPLFDL